MLCRDPLASSDLEPEYTKKFHYLHNINTKQWQFEFKDWSKMALKGNIELYLDYVLVAPTNWQQIFSEFGGAPIIPLFVIDKFFAHGIIEQPEAPRRDLLTDDRFELSQMFENVPDISPISCEIFLTEGHSSSNDQRGILVSKFIGAKVFLNHFSQIFSFPPTKCKLFKADYTSVEAGKVHAEEISTKGTSTKRLYEYRVDSQTKFFVAQCINEDTPFYNDVRNFIRLTMGARDITMIEDREVPRKLNSDVPEIELPEVMGNPGGSIDPDYFGHDDPLSKGKAQAGKRRGGFSLVENWSIP